MIKYDDTGKSGGFGCLGILTLVGLLMMAARWLGIIQWSWWIILAPIYLPPAALLILAAVEIIEGRRNK